MLFFTGLVFAAIPEVNQYKIEKRPVAIEPSPSQYSISADVIKVQKPPFSYYTQLNRLKRNLVYRIPSFPYANHLPSIGKWMLTIAEGQKKLNYVLAHWLNYKSATGQYIIEPINYVFIVFGDDEQKAINHLKNNFVEAGFTTKWSGEKYHSGNYHVYINKQLMSQLKRADGVFITFSDNTCA